ncbi:MAG: hypothetical protein WEC75_03305 [Dehalococcoidia bacterium]
MHALVRTLFPSLLAGVATLALAACGSGERRQEPPGSGDHSYDNFQTAVARADEAGLQEVFWLGPELDVDGVVFDAIEGYFPHGVAGTSLDGAQLTYYRLEDSRGSLSITTLSPSDWQTVEDDVRNPAQPPVERKTVNVGTREAELISIHLDGAELTGLKLLIDYGQSVVIAQTGTAIAQGGREVNPLMDEATFLAVMEDLRPYPE